MISELICGVIFIGVTSAMLAGLVLGVMVLVVMLMRALGGK